MSKSNGQSARRELPFALSAQMAAAVLAGRKSQARVQVKPQPPPWIDGYVQAAAADTWTPTGVLISDPSGALGRGPNLIVRQSWKPVRCPHLVGDLLWVREPLRVGEAALVYAADGVAVAGWEAHFPDAVARSSLPTVLMPRWASRLTLEVTALRARRLQRISDADAAAEGVDVASIATGPDAAARPYLASFARHWDAVHGDGAWAANPWVWVLEFRRVEPNSSAPPPCAGPAARLGRSPSADD